MSTVNQRRQLNLDELRRLKWLLGGAMALVSLWTVFFLDIEALGLVGIVSTVVFAALIWPQFPARVPAIIWRLSVPAIILVATLDFYFSPDTLPVLIRLAILLVFYRAVSYRRKREDLQLIVLGMFLIVVAGVLTVSLGFAFLLLLFTAFALGFLFVINLVDAAENSGAPVTETALAWTRLENGTFVARLRRVADWRLIGFSAALFTAVVVMSGLLFLIIPRFELSTGFFLDRYITRKSRTGFTDNVKFGDVTELVRDDSVAMRVDLTDSRGLSERPYWRMVVLDEYAPQGFRMSPGLRAELVMRQRPMQRVPGRHANRGLNLVGGTWTFYIEPGVSRFFPTPGSFSSMTLRDLALAQYSPQLRCFALSSEPVSMAAFQMEGVDQTRFVGDSEFGRALADARANPDPREETKSRYPLTYLRGAAGEANQAILRKIVTEITRDGGISAEEFSQRATAWLQVHHAYALSVKSPAASGQDEIVRWLNSNEPGFCEYFASGFVTLARAAGYPARLITGFRGGVLNAFENYYMVRNSDAHAWAEIFDGHESWVRVDPTPGAVSTVEAAAAQVAKQDFDSSWSARLDSLRVLWYRRIVNFDSRTQVQMLEQVKNLTQDSSNLLKNRFEEFSKLMKSWLGRPWSLMRFARLAGLIAGVAALIWGVVLVIRWVWARYRRWRRPQDFDPVRREAGRQLARLRLAGEAPSQEGTNMLSDQIVRSGTNGDVDQEVISDLRRLRYGRRESWPEPKSVFKRAKSVARGSQRR